MLFRSDIASVRAAIDSGNKGQMKKWSKEIAKRYNASAGRDGERMQALAEILKKPAK